MQFRLLSFLLLCVLRLSAQQSLVPGEAANWLRQTPAARVLDLRAPDRYRASHLPGAVSMPLDTGFLRRLATLPKMTPLLVYGRGCEQGRTGAEGLRRLGYRNVRWLEGGIGRWYGWEGPLEGGSRVGLSTAEYEKLLQDADVVLVNFHADWCGYCPPVTAAAEKLARTYAGRLKVLVLDTDENPDLARALDIHRLPALVLYQAGQPVWLQVGYLPEGEIERKVRRSLDGQLPTVTLPAPKEP